MTQPNLSNAFKVQDVKSGMLEKICDALGVTIDFFYGGTKYMKNGGEGYVAKEETVGVAQEEDAAILYKKRQQSLADAKDQEIIFLKGQVQALKETIQNAWWQELKCGCAYAVAEKECVIIHHDFMKNR